MSTSTPRHLHLTTLVEAKPEIPLLQSVESVFALCLSDERMKAYSPKFCNDSNEALELSSGGVRQIIVSSSLYSDREKLTAFYLDVFDKNTTMLLVGQSEELSRIDALGLAHIDNRHVHKFGLPSSGLNFLTCIQTVATFQQSIITTDAEQSYLRESSENVKNVMSISRELNGERDIPKLLNLILLKAREITKADAGSIYTVEYTQNSREISQAKLRFRLTQNSSTSTDFSEFTIPIDSKSIVGNAVLTQAPINIPDLYNLSDNPASNPYGVKHNRSFDQRIGYQSHSMLTFPMYDISHNVIGVIQLINRKRDYHSKLLSNSDFEKQVLQFSRQDEEYAQIVAQQAGIALENAEMHNEIRHLFHGFVNASVTAIEQRDPTTSGHSHRVAQLTTELARAVDRSTETPFRDIHFTEDGFREIEYASLLHDFGKLGVRENVLVKSKKLYPWQYENVQDRFELIRSAIEIEYLRQVVNYMSNPMAFPMDFNADNLKFERDRKLAEVEDFVKFVATSNEPTVLPQGGFERLNDIAKNEFLDSQGQKRSFLKSDELKALSVSRGSLTAEEFAEIQSHVTHTYEFLRKIPWGHRLANVPEIAAKHHEKLDGSGYPTSAIGSQIPIQSRMMSIADIYDALTASDRPYKKAVPAEKALDIIAMEVKSAKIDSDLFKLFIDSGAHRVVFERK
ncbi:MAG: GAF domain-containing protein [Proteobacteria bacterium]|nr:GAF domain-containing protein [Pseudomonadota bacterium]